MFAEDAKLLPEKLYKTVLDKSNPDGNKAQKCFNDLFNAMQGSGDFHMTDLLWFNGGLFKKVNVPVLLTNDVISLLDAARLDWSQIEPAIFGHFVRARFKSCNAWSAWCELHRPCHHCENCSSSG